MVDADSITRLNAALEGRYRIERELGAGGMATVYLAEDLRHGRQVALKVLRPELATALGPERFLREIETVARLTHPHVLPLFDSGEADGLLFYVMPCVEGETLKARLEREGALPIDDALRIARECAEALEHAHAQGIIHRDLKPANILFSGGHAVVADFGIARAVEGAADEQALTRTGMSVGSVGYMSPEQATGERTVDERTDVYALGCVLYEMLTGERAFGGRTAQAVMAKQIAGEVPSVRALRPTVPEGLAEAIDEALRPHPAERYRSMGAFRRAFSSSGDPERDSAARTVTRKDILHRPAAVGIGVALVTLLVLAIWTGSIREDASPVSSGPDTPVSEDRVAVFPFQIQGNEDLDYLSQGLMELVSESVDGLGQLRRADPFALLRRLPGEGVVLGPENAEAVAQGLGAGRYVLGRMAALGPTVVQISASLYSLEGRADPIAEASIRGELERIPELVPELVSDLVGDVALDARGRPVRVVALGSDNFEAVKSYVRGLALWRAGHADSAALEFEAAVQVDSGFAPAWLRLTHARGLYAPGDPLEALDRAFAHRERLSPQDEMFAEVLDASWHVESEEAEELALRLVGSYPEMAEGWAWLAGARLWLAWQRDTPYWTSREPLSRALELDPSDPQAHVWAMVLALKERRFSHADSLYRSAWVESGLSRSVLGAAARATLTAELGTLEDRLRFVDGLDSFTEWDVLLMGTAPANYTDDLPMARAVWRKVASSESHSETGRGRARNHLAYLEIGGGRWDDAEAEFRAAAELTPDLTRIMRTWAAAIPAFDRRTSELASLRTSLDAWDAPTPGSSQARDPGLYLPDELRPWVRTYLRGLLSARLGARREAEDAALALEQAQAPPDTLGIRTDLAREIRALVSIEAGRPEEALQLLEDSRLSVDIVPSQFFTLFYTRPLGRLLRAQLLQQLGRDKEALEEALAWYANFAVAWGTEYVFNAPRYLGMAEIYERWGDNEKATEYYRRFLTWWEDADPEYQPLVQDVRERVERLTSVRN